MSCGRTEFQRLMNVSRETLERLDGYEALLRKWNQKINLVAPGSLDHLWTRHFLDSAQIYGLSVSPNHWADLGSGGGFPGAVVAILSANTQLKVTLIESDQRKAAFLRAVSRELEVKFEVRSERIEKTQSLSADIVSARALASLTDLLDLTKRHLSPKGRALFLKGGGAQAEIAEALENWTFDCETHASETDQNAVILNIGEIKRV